MRFKRLRYFTFLLILFVWGNSIHAQGFSFNCARDTILPGCPPNLCFTLKTLIPDPNSLANSYVVNSPGLLPSCLLASNNPGIPGSPTTLNLDDKYSPVFPIGFPFVFFGTPYNNLVVSSNGYLSFDASLTGLFSHWNIINGATPQDLPSTFYDRALIMGPYHDIDVAIATSPSRLISYQTAGLAPYRKWILNYYKIPLFSTACNNLIENTHQIILYESTGIIDVNIFDMQICPGWNQGRAMVGVQDFNRTTGVMAPGRRASDPPWGAVGMNESWRFVPTGGTPLFKRVELYDFAGTLVSTGVTTILPTGDRDVSFPNVCPPAGTTTPYVIKAFYDKIDDPTVEIYATDTVNVNRAQGLAAATSTTAATCGFSNGVINVINTSGGTGSYEYSLDGITWQSSNIFNGVASGTYTVYVRDVPSGTCSATYTAIVGIVSNLAAVTTNTATACTGVNNGTITVTSSMGTAPFTFSLDGAGFVAGTLPYTFNSLTPGNHTVVVKDVNGCTTNTITVNIATGTGVSASSAVTATTCPGVNNGTITITPTAGTAPFTYQLGAGPFQPSNVFTGLAPGTYTITVRDNVGCTRPVTRTIGAGTALLASQSPAATSCFGAANGTVLITPTNGSGPYTFVLDGTITQTGATNTTFSNLATGLHTVVVTDNTTGCISNQINVNIAAGPVQAGTASAAATSCSGAVNGSITITPTNGNGPYLFSLDGATAVAGAGPYTFTNVPAGPHTVIITNADGCVSGSIPVTVTVGPVLTTTASKTDVLCNAGATGTITVAQPTVGNPPYEYSLDGITWQSSNIFNGLIAGTYTVYYRELNGCQNSLSITVDEPASLSAAVAAVPVVCNGQSNGIITLTGSGGVAPYEYSIDAGVNWQSSNIFNVPAGTYTIITRDVNGCTTPKTITVTEPVVLSASSVNTNASCDGGNDGTINITAGGGNTSYEYSIDNGVTWQPSSIFNVAPGNYTVLVRDNLGCSATVPAVVGLTNNLTYTGQTDPTICESKSTQLNLQSNATLYAWTPKIGLSDTTIYNPVANPIVTTQYIVTATLGRCSANDTVIVNVNAAPIPNAGPDGFICYGQSYTLQPTGGVVYSWTPTTYLSNALAPNPVATPIKDITYTMSIVADVNGCASLTTAQVHIDVTPPVKVKTFPYDTIGYPGDHFQILATTSDPDANIFVWSPSTGLSNTNIANPIVTVGPIGGDITYQVIASTIAGCKGEAYVHVKVYTGPDIYVPTGFTPNGDGRNDRFTPFPVGIKSLNYFRVYNRWGQMVFSTSALHAGWDGTFGGKEQASGSYVWMAEGVSNQGKKITKKGVVTLIR